MIRRLLAASLAAALAGCSLIPSASITPRLGPRAIRGDIAVSSSGVSVASDAETLGFDEDSPLLQPRADFSMGPFDFMGSYHDALYEGSGRAEGQLDLGGVIINAGDAVDSELDTVYANLVATMDLVPTDLVDVGIGLGVSYVDFDAMVSSSTDTLRSSEAMVVPLIALRGEAELWFLRANVHVHGMSGSYGGVDATLLEYDAFLAYELADFLNAYAAIVVGYRELLIDVEYSDQGSDIEADLRLGGPYFGLTIGL